MLSRVEIRTVLAVVLAYMARMLGLFMLLPVLALVAADLPGSNPKMVGLTLGVYGLTQALMQIPFGFLSDRWGRKLAIGLGLLIFCVGSVLGAHAETLSQLMIARALQGSGAISGALLALVGDHTQEQNRSSSMAIIGVSIGASFGLAIVLGPLLTEISGVSSVFWLCALLSIVSLICILVGVPSTVVTHTRPQRGVGARGYAASLRDSRLLTLSGSIFFLHSIQMSLWVAVPTILVDQFQLPMRAHWVFYLTVVALGFVTMAPVLRGAEKTQREKTAMLAGVVAVGLSGLLAGSVNTYLLFGGAMVLFFWGFNLLEASLPSQVSRSCDPIQRGVAMSIYSTFQFLGVFAGGLLGGWVVSAFGLSAVFYTVVVIALIWLVLLRRFTPADRVVCHVMHHLSADEVARLHGLEQVREVTHYPAQGETFVKTGPEVEAGTLARCIRGVEP